MVRNDYPRDGDFQPRTDYMDHSPLNTRERKELKKNTAKNLGDLNRELGGDFGKVTVLGTIKTFDDGFGLRIRDDNGDKIGTAYKGEQVRIFGRKKRVADSDGILRNFLKVGVYNNRGKIDEKRSGWVAEDFVEVDQEHINSLIQNLETRIDRQEKSEPPKPEVKKPEMKKPDMPTVETPEKAPEIGSSIYMIQNRDTIGEISKNLNIGEVTVGAIKPNTGFPSYIGDPLAMPTIERLTPTVPEKEATSTPQTEKSEAKTPEMKPETPPVVKSSTYIIQEGDTLGKIADKYNVSKNDLMAENDMWSGHPIYIGETLVIPPTVKEAPTTPTKELPNTPPEKPEVKPDPTKAPDTGSSIYMIQNRDTIGEISRNIKITPEEMIEASKPHAGAPLYITDPLAIPTIDKLTPKTEPEKETPSTPEKPEISAVPEMKIPETPKPAVKPEVEKPETVKGKYENPLLKSDETYGYYTWEANDTMHSLARNFFTTVDELLRLNGKAEGDIFNPGDDVIVPTSKYMVYHDLDSNLKPKVSTVPEMKITETPKPEVKPEVKKPEPPKPEEKKPETAKSQVSPGESKPNLDEIFMNAVKETIGVPVLSEVDEKTLSQSIGEFQDRRERHKNKPDTFNRTFPGRLDDHIKLLNNINISMDEAYFIDIGPGVGDFEGQDGGTRADYPAITSREMAEAFPETQVIAMDLPASIERLAQAREGNKKIGQAVLDRNNLQILAGDGMKGLRDQLLGATDMLGNPLRIPGDNQTIVIRASNSIDIYYPFSDIKAVLEKMVSDFENQRLIILLGKNILHKEAGGKQLRIIGQISERGFNHNQQTTNHVSDETPEYEIYDQYKSFFNK